METHQLRLSRSGLATFSLQLTVVFALVGLVGILNHEMWRDELQAWMLARDSSSVIELYQNMRYEGHPALWHICLYGLTRVSQNPWVMQLFHLGIATANVYLLTQFSPFTRCQKTLLAFGYFSLYEYGLISRSYGLGVLLVVLFCAFYPGYQRQLATHAQSGWRVLMPFVTLGLLANTSVYGLCLSVALSFALAWSQVEYGHWTTPRWLSTGSGVSLLLSSWMICYLQVRRINAGLASTHLVDALADPVANNGLEPLRRLVLIVSQLWHGYVPVPAVWRLNFWNTNFLTAIKRLPNLMGLESTQIIAFFLSLLLIFWVIRLLWQRPKWVFVYSTGTSLILGFNYLFKNAALRHHGHFFILLMACLWLAQVEKAHFAMAGCSNQTSHRLKPKSHWGKMKAVFNLFNSFPKRQKSFFTGLLVLHVFAGLFAYGADLAQPFSGSQATAQFLRLHQLDTLPIFGYHDFQASTLSGYLNKPIYYPNRRQFGSFWTIKHEINSTQVIHQIQAFVSQNDQPVVLVLTEALQNPIANVSLQPLAHLSGELSKGTESFYVYLAQSTISKGQPR